MDPRVADLKRCARRVRELEKGIDRFLEAHDDGEMSNEQAAIEHLRRLLERA